MEISKKPWPVLSLCGIKKRIDTNPDFQRPPVWSRSQKQLLIDTILRSYDIPKLYWRKTGSNPDLYDVVDGQQRLRAIFEFYAGEFALAKDCEPVDGMSIAKAKYADLPDDLRLKFDTYSLDVIILSQIDEEGRPHPPLVKGRQDHSRQRPDRLLGLQFGKGRQR